MDIDGVSSEFRFGADSSRTRDEQIRDHARELAAAIARMRERGLAVRWEPVPDAEPWPFGDIILDELREKIQTLAERQPRRVGNSTRVTTWKAANMRTAPTPKPKPDIKRMIANKNAQLAEQRARSPRRVEDVRDVRQLTDAQARDVALTVLDDRDTARTLSSRSADALDAAIRDNPILARRAVVCETPAYRRAFMKQLLVRDARNHAVLADDERDAMLRAWDWRQAEARAQNEAVNASGGFAVPPTIDPTVVLTDQESANDFWQLARVIDINSNDWRGLKSAGGTWVFQGEGVEAGDSSLTSVGQPDIPVYTLRGFVQYSLEIGEDWRNFADEFRRILSAGYDELTLAKFTAGSGSGEPTGLLTALAAATPTTLITSSTDGAFGEADVYGTWNSLPSKYHKRSTWMMDPSVLSRVRGMSFYHASTVQLDDRINSFEVVFGRQAVENPYFPDWSSTTGASTRLVLGDFSRYVIPRRLGMTVESVGLLPNVSNNRPDGTKGLIAYARVGGDCVDPQAFRYQANT